MEVVVQRVSWGIEEKKDEINAAFLLIQSQNAELRKL